jgi:hypothetical protein
VSSIANAEAGHAQYVLHAQYVPKFVIFLLLLAPLVCGLVLRGEAKLLARAP